MKEALACSLYVVVATPDGCVRVHSVLYAMNPVKKGRLTGASGARSRVPKVFTIYVGILVRFWEHRGDGSLVLVSPRESPVRDVLLSAPVVTFDATDLRGRPWLCLLYTSDAADE